MYFRLAYIMLSYYVSFAAAALLSHDEISREKLDFFSGGLQGLFAGWVLTTGFGDAGAVYAGALYIVCTFASFLLIEPLFRRLIWLLHAMSGAKQLPLAEERYLSVPLALASARFAWSRARGVVWLVAAAWSAFPVFVVVLYHLGLEARW